MTDRAGIFAGDNPIDLFKSWLSEAEKTEINDPNDIALFKNENGEREFIVSEPAVATRITKQIRA